MSKTQFGTKTMGSSQNRYEEDEGRYFSKEETALDPTRWGMIAADNYKSISTTHKILPNGVYTITIDQRDDKPVFVRKRMVHDELIPLLGLPSMISKEMDEFWGKEKDFTKLGFLHRRGYLLYGSHGSGKSSLIHQIIDSLDKGIVFYCGNPKHFNLGLETFRIVEPKRKIVCVFEDIDAIIKIYGESDLLSLLDGENQVSGVINLATTNYPELLDKRIVGRPRRFDRVYKIENLGEKA